MDGFGSQLNKVATEVEALCVDFNKLTANQAATDAQVKAVLARTNDLENRIVAVESNEVELKLSAADEAVILRAAFDQVAHQLVVSGLPEEDGEDVKKLSRSLVGMLDPALDGDVVVDAFRIGKRRRIVGSRRSDLAGPRLIIISLKSSDICKKVVEGKKAKPDLNAKQLGQSLPEVKVYVNFRQPAQLHQLRDRVLQKFPHVDRKHVWISDGAVFLRKTKVDRPEFFRVNPYHVIGVVETWLCDAISDHQVDLPGYAMLRVDRHSKRGGGVALYIWNELDACLLSSSAGAREVVLPEYLIAEYKHQKPTRRIVKCRSWKEADFGAAADLTNLRLPELDIDYGDCVREFTAKRRPAPWITQKLRDIRRERDRCYQRFKRNGHRQAWEHYIRLRRQAQAMWKTSQANYLLSVFSRVGSTK
ncbi:hypothetical protein KQX54_016488 [Cotesia glomerata]|uniref:Transposase n=1 Tax=Cotesia glomerata TaxID=32391 RepID=A0AAV7IRC5_COTGL|nr:hypothetical protein KQX54_016488 [Cotesia glomerata]